MSDYYDNLLNEIKDGLAALLQGNSDYGVKKGNIVIHWSPTKKEFVTKSS